MKIGIVGNGPWGNAYARTLSGIGIECWQATRNWSARSADALVIATPADTHYEIAAESIVRGTPCIIEKPVCLTVREVRELYRLAVQHEAIVFTGHTRLYSPAWRAFKAGLGELDTVFMQAGGPSKLEWLWDWGPHLVAMCLDLGFDPLEAHLLEVAHRIPITVTVNGSKHFTDVQTTPTALEVLISEFCEAVAKGEADNSGLLLGVQVIEILEKMEEAVGTI